MPEGILITPLAILNTPVTTLPKPSKKFLNPFSTGVIGFSHVFGISVETKSGLSGGALSDIL